MAARKTRGPRTPNERATDSARSTATLFENLPPNYLADEYLRPIATLLRFVTGTAYLDEGPRLRDVRRLDEDERRYLKLDSELHGLAARFDNDAEFMLLSAGARKAKRLADSVRRDLRDEKARMSAALAQGEDDDV